MKINEIFIDGFGLFSNTRIKGLTFGINVIYGPNEFGKTTLLEFIRRILFGFPKRSAKTNPYPQLMGGAYGGKLICELSSGEQLIIHREEGKRGGKLTSYIDSKLLSGQEELNKYIGHISQTFYENIYAIKLDELQEIETLESEEVKSRIFGAGLELGSISLTDIKKEFKKFGDSIYKSKGSSQKMALIFKEIRQTAQSIKEIQKGLSEYDDLLSRKDDYQELVDSIENEINTLFETRSSLENMQNLYSTYLEFDTAQLEISNLGEVLDLPNRVLENLEKLEDELEVYQSRLKEEEEEVRINITELNNLSYNEDLLNIESTIKSLHSHDAKFESASKDIKNVKSERDDLTDEINVEIGKLGKGWSAETINKFVISHPMGDEQNKIRDDLTEKKRIKEGAKDKLEYHLEHRASKVTWRFIGPKFYKYAIYGFTLLGGLGLIAGSLLEQWWTLFSFSAIILITGSIVSLAIRKGERLRVDDPLEEKLKKSSDEAEIKYEEVRTEWRDFLHRLKFNEDLAPEGALTMLSAIEKIKSTQTKVEQYDGRIKRMDLEIKKVEKLHNKIASVTDSSKIGDDIRSNINIFLQILDEAKDSKLAKEKLEKQILRYKVKISNLKKNIKAKQAEISNYILSIGAKSKEDLTQKALLLQRRNELKEIISNSEKTIQSTIGRGKNYEKFIKAISKINLDKLRVQLVDTIDKIDKSKEKRKDYYQVLGELGTKIEDVSSSKDHLMMKNELEIQKARLQDAYSNWVKSQIALIILDSAISKYEETRQPKVIKEASKYFSLITNRRYPKIVKPAEGDELLIQSPNKDFINVSQMSRGTKEQLYFAMRLGLIEEYEKSSESLPIILDDILVDFDDERGPLAIEVVKNFSKNRQVLVFTCHMNILDLYRKHNINKVNMA